MNFTASPCTTKEETASLPRASGNKRKHQRKEVAPMVIRVANQELSADEASLNEDAYRKLQTMPCNHRYVDLARPPDVCLAIDGQLSTKLSSIINSILLVMCHLLARNFGCRSPLIDV
jgi:hypothetical protein